MSTTGQEEKIKCPHCGWVRTFNRQVLVDESQADIAKGEMSETLRGAVNRIKEALASSQQDPASYWVDMPTCPYCKNVYQYNVQTRETRK